MHQIIVTALALFSGVQLVGADDPFTFCKDNKCKDCPVAVTSTGTGFPKCVIYNSDDVFSNQGYSGSEGGGWRPYLDVHHQDKGCAIIVKSPADFSTDDCGINIFSSKQEVCAVLDLEKTFMVQFCCGDGDCTAAGANGGGGRATFDGESGMSSGYGLFLQGPNGTVLQPAYMGLPQITTRHEHAHTPTRSRIEKRSCDKKSWVADDGKDEYTRTADGPQIVLSNVKGPTTQTITKERTQSWTSTLSADIGFEDVLHIGLSFEESFTESITDGKSRTFEVLAGQSGDVGFTAYLHCSTGHGKCNGKTVQGEVCTPYKDSSGELAGTYHMIIHS